ncbi:cation:proton antiporter [Agaribacter marinus]|uniref:Potassium transporter n=1 Tax=Agaribacter marinus TaxID=1431249 RepID=A0AA37WIA9_9ALTE|nr:cation:proton antiporter [Agaribacter marinus]GLR70818.1 potassium transporter [Agaribacter marinus]
MNQTFVSILVLMIISTGLIWIFKRLSLPPILAYLVAGILIGPELLNFFSNNIDAMHLAGEVGIVFLLFTLGLEFSLAKMLAMRHLVFGVGAGQMLLTTTFFAAIAMFLGQNISAAIVMGAMLALSSTAIVIKTINEQGRLNTSRSQLAISVLLFQDVAVVPFLIVIPLLASSGDTSITIAILLALLKGVVVIAVLLAAGRWLLPRLFNEIASAKTDELFVQTTIVVALLAAGVTYAAGLSMALGAFLAGMMLSESQYRHQIEADIRPFRDILMGLFFITVGMQVNLTVVTQNWHWILLCLLIIIVVKVLLVKAAAYFYHANKADAWAAGVKLAQIGEFSFVLAALAFENGVISEYLSSMLISIGLVSMAITPWLIDKSDWLAMKLTMQVEPNVEPIFTAHGNKPNVLILGYGRVGQSIGRMLKLEGLGYSVIDSDPVRVHETRAAGESIFFGDAGNKAILEKAHIHDVSLTIVTFDEHTKAISVISAIKHLNADMQVIVRTRKDYNAKALYDAGALQVVPEVQEGSLMLISQVLHYSGLPMSRILKRIRNERKKGYVHMHGFFPGETTEITFDSKDKLEFKHAVVIAEGAYAVGKQLHMLDIVKKRVQVVSLRRDNQDFDNPSMATVLAENDVLIISGKPRRVERVEKHILDGS